MAHDNWALLGGPLLYYLIVCVCMCVQRESSKLFNLSFREHFSSFLRGDDPSETFWYNLKQTVFGCFSPRRDKLKR